MFIGGDDGKTVSPSESIDAYCMRAARQSRRQRVNYLGLHARATFIGRHQSWGALVMLPCVEIFDIIAIRYCQAASDWHDFLVVRANLAMKIMFAPFVRNSWCCGDDFGTSQPTTAIPHFRGPSSILREITMENILWKFRGVYHMESHGISVEFLCFRPSGIPI